MTMMIAQRLKMTMRKLQHVSFAAFGSNASGSMEKLAKITGGGFFKLG